MFRAMPVLVRAFFLADMDGRFRTSVLDLTSVSYLLFYGDLFLFDVVGQAFELYFWRTLKLVGLLVTFILLVILNLAVRQLVVLVADRRVDGMLWARCTSGRQALVIVRVVAR